MERPKRGVHTETVIQPPLPPEVGTGIPTKVKKISVESEPTPLEVPQYTEEQIREFDEGVEWWKR
ncbi:MAG: hypothetical protein US96_C0014G0028 [Candidatus Woesebacteria bacterium GW2011_GWB1_38_5b]|uniref:Uncharacterized protein n=1 Tax=Candidatus Woesebacteria bacterium GW2011_GWB1_38_5b TaxID=1618569 RepID=A0A0G0KID2_9BACT|nr:MAG: hypothetical protein US96_C0014G0028 [Candidatus Woesebacteria bacterium GW2011_GWB1_38_5b]